MMPDTRIFSSLLPQLPNAVVVDWIQPMRYESIASYAVRLGRSLPSSESPIICGVSFGGIVARELAVALNAKTCVLISSVRSPEELPFWLRTFRWFGPRVVEAVMSVGGALSSMLPRRLRTVSTSRLTNFAGPHGEWYRWASAAVLNWRLSKNADQIPCVQIHGDRDMTFPLRYTLADVVVRGAGHMLAMTHSKQVSEKLIELAE